MLSQDNALEYSEPVYTKSVQRAKYTFYKPNIDKKLVPDTRELLEVYSHVPPEQRSQHVHRVRDQAWDIRAYPCTGVGILRCVKAGETLMDVGCFLGHDIRRLAFDGAPTSKLYGFDIVDHWKVGYEMFRDQEHFGAHFIEADMLSTSDPLLLPLKGQVDIVFVLQVLHSWDWNGQVKVAKALSTFTNPGSMIVSNPIGNPNAREVTLKSLGVAVWRQNPESFKNLWVQVGEETGTKWETQAWMRSFEEMAWDPEDGAWMEPGVAIIEFSVKRVQ